MRPLMFGAADELVLGRFQKVYGRALHFRVAAKEEQERLKDGFLLTASQEHLRGLLQGGEVTRTEFGSRQKTKGSSRPIIEGGTAGAKSLLW